MQKGFDVEALLTGDNLTHLLSISLQQDGKKQIKRIDKAFIAKDHIDGETVGTLELTQGDGTTSYILSDKTSGLQIDMETLNVIYPFQLRGWTLSLKGVELG